MNYFEKRPQLPSFSKKIKAAIDNCKQRREQQRQQKEKILKQITREGFGEMIYDQYEANKGEFGNAIAITMFLVDLYEYNPEFKNYLEQHRIVFKIPKAHKWFLAIGTDPKEVIRSDSWREDEPGKSDPWGQIPLYVATEDSKTISGYWCAPILMETFADWTKNDNDGGALDDFDKLTPELVMRAIREELMLK